MYQVKWVSSNRIDSCKFSTIQLAFKSANTLLHRGCRVNVKQLF